MPDIKALNRIFPFAIGFSPFLIGSLVTALYFLAFISLLSEFFPKHQQADMNGVSKIKLTLRYYRWPITIWLLFFAFTTIPLYWKTDMSDALYITGSYMHFLAAPFLLVGLHLRNPDEDYLFLFIKGLRIGVVLVFVITLIQYSYYSERPSAFMGNTLVLASISLLAGFAAMTKLPNDTHTDRLLALASFVCATLIIFMTNARSMIMAWPILLMFLLWHLTRSGDTLRRLLTFIGAASIAVLLLFVLSQNARNVFTFRVIEPIERIFNNKTPEASIQFRLNLLQTGWVAFQEKPFSGHGISNTMDAALNAAKSNNITLQETKRTHLHNDYLNHLVGGGIPLGALFIIILLMPLWLGSKHLDYKSQNAHQYFAYVITIGFGLSALTNLVFGHDILQSYFMISCIFLCLGRSQKRMV